MYYLLVCIVILCLASFEVYMTRGVKYTLYTMVFLLLSFLVAVRYGQGSDYFSYAYLYEDLSDRVANQGNLALQEIGFTYMCYLFNDVLGLSYEVFSAFCSLISLLPLFFLFKKESPLPIFSLFYYFCFFYLTYPYSGIRQAITIGIFAGPMYSALSGRKHIIYFLWAYVAFSIHASAVVFFVLPLLLRYNLTKKRLLFICISLVMLIPLSGLLIKSMNAFPGIELLPIFKKKANTYAERGNELNVLALLIRLMVFVLIQKIPKEYIIERQRELMLSIYNYSFIIYLLLVQNSLVSSRLSVGFRVFEMILIADFLYCYRKEINKKMNYLFFRIGVTGICLIMFYKNIDSYIKQGQYDETIDVFNYPLHTIFNKENVSDNRPRQVMEDLYDDLE